MSHIVTLPLLDCKNRTHVCGFWEGYWLMPCLSMLMSLLLWLLPGGATLIKVMVSNNRLGKIVSTELLVLIGRLCSWQAVEIA